MKYAYILIAAIMFAGCAVTPTGTQPAASTESVVINAEKTLRICKDTFDLFLHIEKTNQVAIKQSLPEVHAYAEYLRKNGPGWLATANDLKNAYEHGSGNYAALLASLNVLQNSMGTVDSYISQINKL